MKIYISTPINGREEQTFALKYAAAKKRVKDIMETLSRNPEYAYAQFISTFDINPIAEILTEAEAMGRCIQSLLECDKVYFDRNWRRSKGCTAEFYVAMNYDIESIKYDL